MCRRTTGEADTQLNTVDLPAPFGPIRAWIEPASTSIVKRLSASRPPKRSVKSRIEKSDAIRIPLGFFIAFHKLMFGGEGGLALRACLYDAPDAPWHEHDRKNDNQPVHKFLPDQQPGRCEA